MCQCGVSAWIPSPSSFPIPSNLLVPAEPVGSPRLETLVLQEEQGRCRLQLSCTVPGATAVSYSWSRDSDPLGNQSVLVVSEYVQPVLYVCNVSNPASWSTASIDMATACAQKGDLSPAPPKLGLGLHCCRLGFPISPSPYVCMLLPWRKCALLLKRETSLLETACKWTLWFPGQVSSPFTGHDGVCCLETSALCPASPIPSAFVPPQGCLVPSRSAQ